MKKYIIITIAIFLYLNMLHSQLQVDNTVYNFYDYQLILFDNRKFSIEKKLNHPKATLKAPGLWNISPTELRVMSTGSFTKRRNTITCYDQKLKRYYVFSILNDSMLLSTKSTSIYNRGDTLNLLVVRRE